ncbi:putative cation-transporting ATPase [Gordonia alkanivorans NBRC 16433]|uniref:Putative cation-transporting ATPase n=1 Tax=Gordonia alkanivorans NBRC 16433 TaxID=1027371 RepID=F9W283_9ACTN|nr:putative cation-transporting ATPase [Gordonia alkanivorans NBRC 16433]
MALRPSASNGAPPQRAFAWKLQNIVAAVASSETSTMTAVSPRPDNHGIRRGVLIRGSDMANRVGRRVWIVFPEV